MFTEEKKEKEEQEGFTVIDRRGGAGNEKETEKKRSSESELGKKQEVAGEGFVMQKENPSSLSDKDAGGIGREIDFSALVLSLGTGALMNLGVGIEETGKQGEINLELAKQNIEILSLLREKTKGNLTDNEKQLLENLLTETRLRFVECSKAN